MDDSSRVMRLGSLNIWNRRERINHGVHHWGGGRDDPGVHHGNRWIYACIHCQGRILDILGIYHRRRKINCCIHSWSENSQLGVLVTELYLRLAS